MVLAGMLVYRLSIVPAIEPAQTRRAVITAQSEAPEAVDSWWSNRFAQDAWQNSSPTVLKTQMVTLLCKDWKPIGTDSLQLAKLTMLVPYAKISKSHRQQLSDSAKELPRANESLVIIEASEGAIIQFKEAPNWLSGSMPPIIGGRLVGAIRIYNSPGTGQTEKPWELKTREVRIERRRFWTTDAVELNYADGFVRGRDLSIYLKQDLLSPNTNAISQSSQWGLLDHLNLIYVDKVEQRLPDGGLWASMSLGTPGIASANTKHLPAKVQLEPGSRFRFDFNRSEATLSDKVRLTHQLGELTPDQLWCNQLTLTFDATSPKPAANTATTGKDAGEVWIGPMKLSKVDAIGSDVVGPLHAEPFVRLDSPTMESSLQCKRAEIILPQNDVRLYGSLTKDSVATVVRLRHLGYEFLSPAIQYIAASDPNRIGTLFAPGPGELHTPTGAHIGQWQARWNQSFSLVPVDGLHKITLLGKAFVESPSQGHLAGGIIECWLKQASSEQLDQQSARDPNSKFDVEQAHAKDAVQLAVNSKNLQVKVEELWLEMFYPDASGHLENDPAQLAAGLQLNGFFGPAASPPVQQPIPQSQPIQSQTQQVPLPQPTLPAPQTTAITNQTLQPEVSQTPTVSAPTVANPNLGQSAAYVSLPLAQPNSSEARPMPIVVIGKTLNSKIVWLNQQSWIDDLTIDGPLTIARTGTETLPQSNWEIRGDQLRTATNAAGQADLQIVGQPAVIALGQGGLAGNVIRLDQKLGLVWMDQPGFFSLPPDVLQTQAPGAGLQWLKPLSCQWVGRMIFDGKTARVEGQVQFSGQLRTENRRKLLIDGNCHSLEIHLNQSINFNKPQVDVASLEAVVLQDGVLISISQIDEQEKLYSRERISVPRLVYEYSKNRLVGNGPGWIRSRHPSQSRTGSTPFTQASSQSFQGVHLKFRDVMEARLDANAVAFKGQVRVVLGPLSSLEDDLDMDRLRFLSPGQMELSSDLMQAYDLSTLSTTRSLVPSNTIQWEFKADGNVNFESVATDSNTSGTAHELIYTQPKDLLVIKGDGKSPAFLKRTPASQSSIKELNVHVRTATINLRTMQVEAEPVAIVIPFNTNARDNAATPPQPAIVNPRDLDPLFRPR